MWCGQSSLPSGHLVHLAYGLRCLLCHLLWRVHGPTTSCAGEYWQAWVCGIVTTKKVLQRSCINWVVMIWILQFLQLLGAISQYLGHFFFKTLHTVNTTSVYVGWTMNYDSTSVITLEQNAFNDDIFQISWILFSLRHKRHQNSYVHTGQFARLNT